MYKPTLTIIGCITTVIYLYIFSCSSVEGQSFDLDATSDCSEPNLVIESLGDGTGRYNTHTCSPKSSVLSKDFSQPYHYNGAKYYVSKALFTTDMAAVDVCKSICGYLVEMDDNAEMDFLRTILNKLKTDGILIAGTDKAKEGTWVFQRNGKALTFKPWYVGEPNNFVEQDHCITMLKKTGGMFDIPCQLGFWQLNFVCEVK